MRRQEKGKEPLFVGSGWSPWPAESHEFQHRVITFAVQVACIKTHPFYMELISNKNVKTATVGSHV